MNKINPNKAIVCDLFPISQLSEYSDLMTFTLKHLTSQEALASRTVCTRWNELISTKCIVPILYRELEPQVAPFLGLIGRTLRQYFSERGIDLLSLNSVENAYHYLRPIKWDVSLGECLQMGDLSQITPISLMQNIQHHFINKYWRYDYPWRTDLYDILSKFGFPTSTWNQLALALGVPVKEWNQQLIETLSRIQTDEIVAERLEKYGVKPGTEDPDFDPLTVAEKINAFAHNKAKGTPYFQLCASPRTQPPATAREFAFVDDKRDNSSIFFSVNEQLLYNYFPCTLLGFKTQDYVGKDSLLLDSTMGQDFCFPINGQFFKFTICPAYGFVTDPGEDEASSDGDSSLEVVETFERQVQRNGWECMSSFLYIPEDEHTKFKITR
jgi:hypothetical protein